MDIAGSTGMDDKLVLIDNSWENIENLTPKNKWVGYHFDNNSKH